MSDEKKEVPNVSAELTQETPEAVTVDGPTTSIVRRTAVPRELDALGVKVAVDPESDMQILIIPKELRTKFNVLAPVQAFQQADPNWRPSLRVVELDPSENGPHFYKQQGKLAPRKQALELLADAAGIVQMNTTLVGRERVEVGGMMAETFTHVASAKIRKSDGTLRSLQASRTYEPFAEYEELKPSSKGDADLRKKWINEIRFAKAKNESKAINRAIRAAIQISHSYTAADAAKPFVVVGWNLAPQSSEEVSAAIAQLYGAAPAALEQHVPHSGDWDLPELAEGEVVEEDAPTAASSQQVSVEAESPPVSADAPGPQESPAAASGEPTRESEAAPSVSESAAGAGDEEAPENTPDPAPAPPPTEEPTIPGVEPTAQPEEDPADTEALAAALQVKLPQGSYQGRTLAWVLELGAPADEWLSYALRQPWLVDQGFKQALTFAIRAHRPAMYAAWRAEV